MTTTIALPDYLAAQLQQRTLVQHRSLESLVIEYLETQMQALPSPPTSAEALANNAELLALVARIKATQPNPTHALPSQAKLTELLAVMVQGEPDHALLAALDAAELELRALNAVPGLRLANWRTD